MKKTLKIMLGIIGTILTMMLIALGMLISCYIGFIKGNSSDAILAKERVRVELTLEDPLGNGIGGSNYSDKYISNRVLWEAFRYNFGGLN